VTSQAKWLAEIDTPPEDASLAKRAPLAPGCRLTPEPKGEGRRS
jgi:hypothetical protein